MIKTEKGNKYVKDQYERSSKVQAKVLSEIAKNIQNKRIFSDTLDILREERGKRKREDYEHEVSRSSVSYTTESGIEYRCFSGESNLQRLCYSGTGWKPLNGSTWKFLSPALSTNLVLSNVLESLNNSLPQGVYEIVKAGRDSRYSVSMAGSFKVLSEEQGIQNFQLCCSRTVNGSSEENSLSYKRFDWITVTGQRGRYFKVTKRVYKPTRCL